MERRQLDNAAPLPQSCLKRHKRTNAETRSSRAAPKTRRIGNRSEAKNDNGNSGHRQKNAGRAMGVMNRANADGRRAIGTEQDG